MERALLLARNGEGRVSPNPMVGAVIVHDGRIIGEGFHAFYGGPHAEVNAISSVKEEDRSLLKDSTIYVTLEPCSHYGKTPPCAELIVKTGIPKVVVGITDPNPKVAGNGIRILREAGIEVETGVMEKECLEINRRFFKAHNTPLPWIILKWAQSADGFMAGKDSAGKPKSIKFSNPLSTVWMHRERSKVDGIMVGSMTELLEHPRLNVREWGGNSPRKIMADSNIPLRTFLENIRKEGISSIMIEGGRKLLQSFIKEGLYDEIRVEISPLELKDGIAAPPLPEDVRLVATERCRDNIIFNYRR